MENPSCNFTTWVFHSHSGNSKQNIFQLKFKESMEKPSCKITTWVFHSHSGNSKQNIFSIKIQSKHGKTKL